MSISVELSVSMKNIIDHTFLLGDASNKSALIKVTSVKDLGVICDSKLKFEEHIIDKINRAYTMLENIRRNFSSVDTSTFIMLYKTLVRS